MGCEVNGPGEAKEADWGIAFATKGRALIFSRGERIKLVKQEEAEEELINLITKEWRRKNVEDVFAFCSYFKREPPRSRNSES
jgi:(E)-4-hydroxy-3-methylbut-2-enyl-diphosphate synthase